MNKVTFGRRPILTSYDEITPDNVLKFLDKTKTDRTINKGDIKYLWNYYKGKQPVLARTKSTNSDILLNTVENKAWEYTNFKAGYLVGDPIQYSADFDNKQDNVIRLNKFMQLVNKAKKDKDLADYVYATGVGFSIVLPTPDKPVPFSLDVLSPLEACCAYNNGIRKDKVAGIYEVEDGLHNIITTVYTPKYVMVVKDGTLISTEYNGLGMIPIVEWHFNEARIGEGFEPILSMLDAINEFDSDRIEAVAQFVQAILVLYNVELPDDIDTQALREKGLLLLKQVGEYKPEVQSIADQLDQAQNQALKEDLEASTRQIIGIPTQSNGNTSDSSNNGATIVRNGWTRAEAMAKDNENAWKASEVERLAIVLRILNSRVNLGFNLNAEDINIHFTRRNYEDILSKSNVLVSLLSCNKVAPIDAYNASGMFIDSEEACKRGLEWYEKHKDETDEGEGAQGNTSDKNYVGGYYRSDAKK